jgi:hypothetical protein
MTFPEVVNPDLFGTYPALVKSGGGYVWDAVLEYRVWCHPEHGAKDLEDGDDYYYAFGDYQEAMTFHQGCPGSEEPLALILQEEHNNQPEPGTYQHIKLKRLTEWPVSFLKRPKRNYTTISDFLPPDAPAKKLDILRGIATT